MQRIETVLHTAGDELLRHQRPDGAFVFRCEASPLPDALMVILLKMMGRGHDPLIPLLTSRLMDQQTSSGEWCAYPNQQDTVSATTLAYFALRLTGHDKTAPNMEKARREMARQGGVGACSNLTKMILAMTGQIPWTAVPMAPIELIHFAPHSFVSLYDFVTYTRWHLVPFMVLSHLQFSYPVTPLSEWAELTDSHLFPAPTLRVPRIDQIGLERCVDFILSRLEPNGTLASYLTATAFAVFALQAVGYTDEHPVIERAICGLKSMVHKGKRDVHQPLFTSTVWDTALCMRALHAVQHPHHVEALERAGMYLRRQQHHLRGDWAVHNRQPLPGGWGFSDVNTLLPDVDDTAACLLALSPIRKRDAAGWERGAAWLLSMQNRDGGWSAFDKDCHKYWLEYLPINDMGPVMTDPSTPDLTGRVLETLALTGVEAQTSVQRGVRWLLHRQKREGSWLGRWGIAYLYGTWTALVGLRASGIAPEYVAMRKAKGWLESVQHEDGGFGESCSSGDEHTYVDLDYSLPSQTAWGLMALLASTDGVTPAIDRAATYLLQHTSGRGVWEETVPTGVGVAGQAYLRYHSYPLVWPMLALQAYRDRIGLREDAERHPDIESHG